MLNLRQRLGDKIGIAATLHQLGWLLFQEGKTDEAIQFVLSSFKIEEAIGHLHGMADSLELLGCIYFNIKQLRTAQAYYEKSLEIDIKLNRKKEAGETLANLEHIKRLTNNGFLK